MFGTCIIGIFNIALILMGFGVIFTAFWLTDQNINTFDDVTISPSSLGIPQAQWDVWGLPSFTIDISSILNSAVNGSSLAFKIFGGIIFGIGCLGFVAFCCKIRWMAWLYILILLVMITLEIVWGVLSVAAFNNDKFPVDNDQIQNDINGLFTGTAIDGYDNEQYGDFYCMNLTAASGADDASFPSEYNQPGYFTYLFTDSINAAADEFKHLDECTPPGPTTTFAECEVLSEECEDNITLWLIRQVYYVGLITLILACISLVVALLCMCSLHRMNKEKRAKREQTLTEEQRPIMQGQVVQKH